MLLDQDGFECDPINRSDGDTPLHCAVRYINSLPSSPDNTEFSSGFIEMMVDAGSDPRIRNNAMLTPAQLVDPSNTTLRRQLQDAIEIAQNAGDFVATDEEEAQEDEGIPEEYEGSDSDFDPEEFKREVEKRKRAAVNAVANGDGGMI